VRPGSREILAVLMRFGASDPTPSGVARSQTASGLRAPGPR
jgi:hypothetical protein